MHLAQYTTFRSGQGIRRRICQGVRSTHAYLSVLGFISDKFRPPWPDRKGGGRCGISRREANVAWSDSYHLSVHLRATPEEGGVVIWEVVFQKNPVTKRGHPIEL